MRASMAFLVQQILDEPHVSRNFALGHEGTNGIESFGKDSNFLLNPSKRIRRKVRILLEGFNVIF